MTRVLLMGDFARAAGTTEIEIVATNIRGLFAALAERCPGLAAQLEGDEVAVAIDGVIFQDALLQPIPDGAEVCLVPKIAGG